MVIKICIHSRLVGSFVILESVLVFIIYNYQNTFEGQLFSI